MSALLAGCSLDDFQRLLLGEKLLFCANETISVYLSKNKH